MKYCINKEHYPQMNNCYSYCYKNIPNKITDNYYYNNNFDKDINNMISCYNNKMNFMELYMHLYIKYIKVSIIII